MAGGFSIPDELENMMGLLLLGLLELLLVKEGVEDNGGECSEVLFVVGELVLFRLLPAKREVDDVELWLRVEVLEREDLEGKEFSGLPCLCLWG